MLFHLASISFADLKKKILFIIVEFLYRILVTGYRLALAGSSCGIHFQPGRFHRLPEIPSRDRARKRKRRPRRFFCFLRFFAPNDNVTHGRNGCLKADGRVPLGQNQCGSLVFHECWSNFCKRKLRTMTTISNGSAQIWPTNFPLRLFLFTLFPFGCCLSFLSVFLSVCPSVFFLSCFFLFLLFLLSIYSFIYSFLFYILWQEGNNVNDSDNEMNNRKGPTKLK